MDPASLLGYSAKFGVERDVADVDPLLGSLVSEIGSADGGPNPRGQFAHVKRFGDIVVRTRFEGAELIVLTIPDGKHENRQGGKAPPDFPAGKSASHTRHIHIEQDRIV